MLLSARMPRVKDTYFQHKLLSKLPGHPSYESLRTLETELKANAGSVPSTAGGGNHGHLGLILSPLRYATLAGTIPWVSPANPGPFVPPVPPGTAAQIEAARDAWLNDNQAFQLCQATEKALVAQIVEALDPIYIRALLNRVTGQYATDMRAVMTHLFSTYGKITPQQVSTKQQAALVLQFDITQPVDTVFNTVEDLAELAEHATSPMTEQQQIDMAYVILAREPILQQDIRLWNRRPVAERTWPNLVTHFREAQSDLSALPVAADMYRQQPGHQANSASAIADLVAQRLWDSMPEEAPVIEPPTAPVEQANAAHTREPATPSREAALLEQMEAMMALMRTATNNDNNNNNSRNRSSSNNRGRGRQSDRGNDGGRGNNPTRSGPRKYCWSHGCCAHSGTECNTTLPGHQTAATFTNMMNGSKTGCYWLPT